MNVKAHLTVICLFFGLSTQLFASVDDSCNSEKTWSAIQHPEKNQVKSDSSKDENTQLQKANTNDKIMSEAKLKLNLETSQIQLGQPFSFTVELCHKNKNGKMIKPDRIIIDALMPAHQHGMNYTPKITYNDEKKQYEISSFLFHMPGEWEINLSSYYADQATYYTKTITLN